MNMINPFTAFHSGEGSERRERGGRKNYIPTFDQTGMNRVIFSLRFFSLSASLCGV
jgi:hypothetical protein